MRFIFESVPCRRCHGTKKVGHGQCFTCNGRGVHRTALGERAFQRLRLYFRQQQPIEPAPIVAYVGHGIKVLP